MTWDNWTKLGGDIAIVQWLPERDLRRIERWLARSVDKAFSNVFMRSLEVRMAMFEETQQEAPIRHGKRGPGEWS